MKTALNFESKRNETTTLIWVPGLKAEIFQGSWLRSLQKEKVENKHKDETKADEEMEEQVALVLLITHLNNILQSIFSRSWGVLQQSENIQFKWILCAKV